MFEDGRGEASAIRAPGPDAAGWLAHIDLRTADQASRLDALELVQRHAAWLASIEAELLASMQADSDTAAAAGSLDGAIEKDWLSEQVGAILRLRGDHAKDRMMVASQLVNRLRAAFGQLAAGLITPIQSRLLAEAAVGLPDEACARVEARVLVRAADQSTTQFRKSLARAVLAADPKTADELVEQAAAERRVMLIPAEHGMAILWALLPAAEAMRLKTAIWQLAMARKNDAAELEAAELSAAEDPGPAASNSVANNNYVEGYVPVDRYRADALVELGDRYLAATDPMGVVNHYAPRCRLSSASRRCSGRATSPVS